MFAPPALPPLFPVGCWAFTDDKTIVAKANNKIFLMIITNCVCDAKFDFAL
jgi:hypothetical protein